MEFNCSQYSEPAILRGFYPKGVLAICNKLGGERTPILKCCFDKIALYLY